MYALLYKRTVEKELRKLPVATRRAVVRKIQTLATDPRPTGSVKLRGSDSLYRLRHADYRIIYRVDDGVLTILIIKIGHRREIYRDF